MGAWNNAMQAAPIRGVVGRAASTSMFDLDRWAPSNSAGRFVEHFWSVSWDLRGQAPLSNTVITFPSMHITHEWGTDSPRHGFALPNTLVHGVDFADLAVRLGWYDQAHFINDFRVMLGVTPGEYASAHGG